MKHLRLNRVLGTVSLITVTALLVALPAWAQTEPAYTTGGDDAAEASTSGEASEPATPDDATRSGSDDTSTDGFAATAGDRDRRRFGDRTLRKGMRGRDVRTLQKILRHLNLTVRVTGRFNRNTRREVRRYDIWKEDKVNGVVHPKQADRMRKLERRGVSYRAHMFPVRGPHDYGGAGSRFGAPRSGHTHQGQDVSAASGTKLVAVHEGRVTTRQYQAGGAGYYVVIRGKDGSDSVYMHLLRQARVGPGDRVLAGTVIGRVGSTGSSTGPHLHFELWTQHWYAGGSAYDPLPKLQKWDRRT